MRGRGPRVWAAGRDVGLQACLAPHVARGKRLWGFDEKERRLLVKVTSELPKLRALVQRAEPRPDIGDVWLVQATVSELDEMYSLVEALMDSTRSGQKLRLLDGMLASLCTSIDGF